MEFRDNRIDEL